MKIAIAAAELAVPQQWTSLELIHLCKIHRLNLRTCSTMVYKCFDTSAGNQKEGFFSRAKSAFIGFSVWHNPYDLRPYVGNLAKVLLKVIHWVLKPYISTKLT